MLAILRMAFGAVVHLLVILLKIVYNILAFLKVRLLALYLIVCGILQLAMHPFTGEKAAWFWIGVVICLLATLTAWSWKFRSMRRRKPRYYEEDDDEEDEPEQEAAVAEEPEPPPKPKPARVHYPKYFEAAGHEGYIFAEYSDRYELYRREGDKFSLVRVDEKPLEKE